MMAKRAFDIWTAWDAAAGVWWGSNDELPLVIEAATLDVLLDRVLAIAPGIAIANGLATAGDEIKCQLVVTPSSRDAPRPQLH